MTAAAPDAPAPPPRARPSTLEELRRHLENQRDAVLPAFAARPSDVFISTFSKSGTTWVQQIVHGLRSNGSMEFPEISLIIPWFEAAQIMGIDVNAPQVAEPRAFKTHLPWDKVPKGCRYIYVVRNPADALVSYYHYMNGVMFERDTIDLDAFCAEVFSRPKHFGTYFSHLRSWWEQRHRADVLSLCFEDMKQDHADAVRRIARFLGIAASEELLERTTRQSTFEFMLAHRDKFEDASATRAFSRMRGLSPASTAKIRAGRVGDGASLSVRLRGALDDAWARELAGPLGLSSYDELRATMRGEAG
jgi:hypothetical protein